MAATRATVSSFQWRSLAECMPPSVVAIEIQDVGDPRATRGAPAGRAGILRAPNTSNGTWRSSVAHLLWEQGVVGSNPAVPTN
jgi:hypothetical protein